MNSYLVFVRGGGEGYAALSEEGMAESYKNGVPTSGN